MKILNFNNHYLNNNILIIDLKLMIKVLMDLNHYII